MTPLAEATLEIVGGGEVGRRLALSRATATLGRAPGNTHVLADTTLSRQHAKLFVRDDRHWIADLNSSHGTFVNGARVTLQVLANGDEVKIGSTVLRFRSIDAPVATAPAAPIFPADARTGSFDLELPDVPAAGSSKPILPAPSGTPASTLPPGGSNYRRAVTLEGEDPFSEEKAATSPSAPQVELRGETARQFASRSTGVPPPAAARNVIGHTPPPLPKIARSRGPLAFLRDDLDQRSGAARFFALLLGLAVAGGALWLILRAFDALPASAPSSTDDVGPQEHAPQRPLLPQRK